MQEMIGNCTLHSEWCVELVHGVIMRSWISSQAAVQGLPRRQQMTDWFLARH